MDVNTVSGLKLRHLLPIVAAVYPITKIGKVPGVAEARARFLLDEFPPQRGTETPPAPAPTPAPTSATSTSQAPAPQMTTGSK